MTSTLSRDRKIVDRISFFTPQEIGMNLNGLGKGPIAIEDKKNNQNG